MASHGVWTPWQTKIQHLDEVNRSSFDKILCRIQGFLFKMAHVRKALDVCSYLMFCDETLVSMSYKISVIYEHASVHNPPKKRSSSDSLLSELKLGKIGRGSPKASRDKQKNSAEDSNATKKCCRDGRSL